MPRKASHDTRTGELSLRMCVFFERAHSSRSLTASPAQAHTMRARVCARACACACASPFDRRRGRSCSQSEGPGPEGEGEGEGRGGAVAVAFPAQSRPGSENPPQPHSCSAAAWPAARAEHVPSTCRRIPLIKQAEPEAFSLPGRLWLWSIEARRGRGRGAEVT